MSVPAFLTVFFQIISDRQSVLFVLFVPTEHF